MRRLSSTAPFVEARHTLGKQRPTAIELRTSFTTSAKGAALGVAQYWHSALALKHPSHYVVDEANVYQCIPDDIVANSYDGSKKGILLITVCSEPVVDSKQWFDTNHLTVLAKTFNLMRELSKDHRIPLRYLDDVQIARWNKFKLRRRGGVIVNITGAWPDCLVLED